MVMYDQDCINWMNNRNKSETRRLYNPNKRPGIPGSIHWIKKDRTPTVYGQYLVLSCEPQRFGDMICGDTLHEGEFENLKEYKEYFYSVNGFIEDDDFVWVMKFLILWTNVNGIILTDQEKKKVTNHMKILLNLYNGLKEQYDTYAPYRRDPVEPLSLKRDVGIINLYNIKDKDVEEYIDHNTPYAVETIFHNGFTSKVFVKLNKTNAKLFKELKYK